VQIRVVTLFPELFDSPLNTGLVGRALERGDVQVSFANPRDFATDRHRTVDDQPYGGGGGMVLRVEPWVAAIEHAPPPGPVLLSSPQGAPLRQADFARWAEEPGLTIVAGRYEGFDERIRRVVDEEVSLGDFVLTGGELAALTIIDGVVRLRPGTLGNADSPHEDSFGPGLSGLLEYPHYTRPPEWRGLAVPEVLRSGDHARVDRWRRAEAVRRTARRRPDRLRTAALDPEDLRTLAEARSAPPRPRLVVPDGFAPETLAALAAAYALDVEIVAPGRTAAWAEALAALPRPAPPAPRGRRSRRTEPPPPAGPAPADRLSAVEAPTAPRPGQPVVGLTSELRPDLPRLAAPPGLRAAAPMLVWRDAVDPARWTATAAGPREMGALGLSLGETVTLALGLDRAIGDG
jgi:tRNA (guanine37-N1)-methyltransferase